jgi:hypothetical protein
VKKAEVAEQSVPELKIASDATTSSLESKQLGLSTSADVLKNLQQKMAKGLLDKAKEGSLSTMLKSHCTYSSAKIAYTKSAVIDQGVGDVAPVVAFDIGTPLTAQSQFVGTSKAAVDEDPCQSTMANASKYASKDEVAVIATVRPKASAGPSSLHDLRQKLTRSVLSAAKDGSLKIALLAAAGAKENMPRPGPDSAHEIDIAKPSGQRTKPSDQSTTSLDDLRQKLARNIFFTAKEGNLKIALLAATQVKEDMPRPGSKTLQHLHLQVMSQLSLLHSLSLMLLL